MNEADAIISDFIADGAESKPYERMLTLARDDPRSLGRLVRRVLDDLPHGSWLVDGALPFLSESEVADVIDLAIRKLEADPESEVASSIIAHASLQVPHALTKHLLACWALRPNQETYYEPWPWRSADDAETSRLLAVGRSDGDDAERAWRCLLETRRPSLVTLAARALAGRLEYDDWLKQVGFIQDGDTLARLHTRSVWHIQFPDGYFEDKGTRLHPTWSSKPIDAPVPTTFGGSASGTCPFCHGSLHHLFELPQHVVGTALSIVTCLSCLGWEESVLFYKHDLSGMPMGLNPDQHEKAPRFPAGPLRSTPAQFVKLSKRWEVQDWALANSEENLNRVGGEPCWVQYPEYPACLSCSKTMGFLAQLDSNPPIAPGRWWLWGSGGICYIFWCEACRISALRWQCT